MDYLAFVNALGVALAAGAGWYLRGRRASELPQVIREVVTVVASNGADKVYVRFTRADGQVKVKKFRSVDIDLKMEFEGRLYEAAEWTDDGHVFREVVSG